MRCLVAMATLVAVVNSGALPYREMLQCSEPRHCSVLTVYGSYANLSLTHIHLYLSLSHSASHALTQSLSLSPAVFPEWAGPDGDRGWSWPLCIKWEASEGLQSWGLGSPVWCMLYRGGREKLEQACQRSRGALQLPKAMLQLKLPRLFNIHQVPKVGFSSSALSVV